VGGGKEWQQTENATWKNECVISPGLHSAFHGRLLRKQLLVTGTLQGTSLQPLISVGSKHTLCCVTTKPFHLAPSSLLCIDLVYAHSADTLELEKKQSPAHRSKQRREHTADRAEIPSRAALASQPAIMAPQKPNGNAKFIDQELAQWAVDEDVFMPESRRASILSAAPAGSVVTGRRLSSLGSLHHAGHSESFWALDRR